MISFPCDSSSCVRRTLWTFKIDVSFFLSSFLLWVINLQRSHYWNFCLWEIIRSSSVDLLIWVCHLLMRFEIIKVICLLKCFSGLFEQLWTVMIKGFWKGMWRDRLFNTSFSNLGRIVIKRIFMEWIDGLLLNFISGFIDVAFRRRPLFVNLHAFII